MPRVRRGRGKEVLMKSAEMLGWALGGLEREIAQTRQRLAELTAQATRLRARVGAGGARRGPTAAATFDEPAVSGGRARRMSREARKRISEMMKKRWAERRKAKANK